VTSFLIQLQNSCIDTAARVTRERQRWVSELLTSELGHLLQLLERLHERLSGLAWGLQGGCRGKAMLLRGPGGLVFSRAGP